MEIKKRVFFEGGRNDQGIAWSVKLELPHVGNERVDAFYEKARDCLIDRAKREGINIFSYLTPTFVSESEISLYTDVLFCRGRELIALFRLPDNRCADGNIVKKSGRGTWYKRSDGIYACKVTFEYDKDYTVKRTDYLKYITERRLRASSPSADDNVDGGKDQN